MTSYPKPKITGVLPATLGAIVAIVVLASCRTAPAAEAQLPDPAPMGKHAIVFEEKPGRNPEKARLAEAGELAEANASWWGFDPDDSTEYLRAAVDSGVEVLRIPDMGAPWAVETIKLRSNQEIVFEAGSEVKALRGAFHGRRNTLLDARNIENVTLRGYGATVRMWKSDYQGPEYSVSEWRHAINLRGVTNFEILGLTVKSSGGDGVYVGRGTSEGRNYSKNVVIRDAVIDDNHRQGVSVISVENLLIENTRLTNTWGTLPQAGIDFEPNRSDERIVNAVVRNSYFAGNQGAGVLVWLENLDEESIPVSITIEDSVLRRNMLALCITGRHQNPHGTVAIRDSEVRGIRWILPGDNLQVELLE